MTRRAKRILWVDDEIDLLRPHLLFLQQRGYHVDAITNGDDGLALLRKDPYDLILLDEQMPGISGLEVLEVLRREDPHARVVMVSKSEEDRTMTEAIGRRVDAYLVKPTSPTAGPLGRYPHPGRVGHPSTAGGPGLRRSLSQAGSPSPGCPDRCRVCGPL